MDKQLSFDPTTGELIAPDEAWNRHQRIVMLRNMAEKTFLDLGEELYKFYYSEDYTKLGYETFESYLADPEVDISRGTATKLIEVYRKYNLKLNIFAAKLLPVGTEKLYLLSKYVDDTNVDEWINKASSLSRSDLREEIFHSFPPPSPPPLPDGKYRVIYADPPWKYSDKLIEGYGAAEHHYPTLTIEEICNYSDGEKYIKDLPTDNAVLFMWVTSPVLEDGFEVIRAWGFEYKASFIWDKTKHNYGHYNSVRHELLLICTRGSCMPDVPELIDSVQSIERNGHSAKPEEFRTIIDKLYPSGKRIELFARRAADGWETWGQ